MASARLLIQGGRLIDGHGFDSVVDLLIEGAETLRSLDVRWAVINGVSPGHVLLQHMPPWRDRQRPNTNSSMDV